MAGSPTRGTAAPPPVAAPAPEVSVRKLERPGVSIGRVVLIQTPEPINGQREQAAMVTQVLSEDVINAMVMPGAGLPYPVGAIAHESNVAPGALCWRWPPKV